MPQFFSCLLIRESKRNHKLNSSTESVINLVYKVASYTYGPILGMFAFGMFTRLKVRDRWMPLVALAAPALSALVQWWALKTWDYQIGFELLIYNAAFTMIGMLLLVKRHEK